MAQPTRVRAGARTRSAEAGRKLLHARFADVEKELARAAHRFEPDPIHDLRVACRRLRAAMKLFGKKELRRQGRHLKRLQDALGELRDEQLTLAWLERHRAAALAAGVRGKIDEADAKLRKAIALWSLRSQGRVLRALVLVHRGGRLGGERMRRRLRKRLRRVRRALSEQCAVDPRAAHALRIAAKKLRYDAELLRGAFELDELLDAAKELQDVFGDLHDADVRLELAAADERLRRIARRERERQSSAARALLDRFQRERVLGRLAKSI